MTRSNTSRPPAGLGTSGQALWRAVVDEYELTEHELVLLREGCRTVDSLDALQTLLDAEGLMGSTSQGPRIHPAMAELRQQRMTLARLLAALHIPTGEATEAGPARAVRGVYQIRGA